MPVVMWLKKKIIQGVALFILTDDAARVDLGARIGEIVSLRCRRSMRDLYLLVTVDHSHAYFDQNVPLDVWAQLFLHRLRTWRVDFFSRLDRPLACGFN